MKAQIAQFKHKSIKLAEKIAILQEQKEKIDAVLELLEPIDAPKPPQ